MENIESQKKFENSISILNKLKHPLIIPIEGIFYDGRHCYVQMPYYEKGTYKDWLFGNENNNNNNSTKTEEGKGKIKL